MKILFLDDEAARHDIFEKVHAAHEVWHAYDADQFWKAIAKVEKFDVISFDHDLGDTKINGNEIARVLVVNYPKSKWPRECWVHSFNPDGAKNIISTLRSAGIPAAQTSLYK